MKEPARKASLAVRGMLLAKNTGRYRQSSCCSALYALNRPGAELVSRGKVKVLLLLLLLLQEMVQVVGSVIDPEYPNHDDPLMPDAHIDFSETGLLGIDSSLHFAVLPLGVDHENQTVVNFWSGDHQGHAIPSAKVTLLVWIRVGANFPNDHDFGKYEIKLALNNSLDARRNKVLAYGLATSYTLNIGAAGHWTLQGCLSYGERTVALGGMEFTLGPLRSETTLAWRGKLFGATDVSTDVTGDSSCPPATVPTDLWSNFTMQGRAALYHWYMDDRELRDKSYQAYDRNSLDVRVEKARNRGRFYYGLTDAFLYESLEHYPITGKALLIVGSNTPVYESICIAFGAVHCVTLEYNELRFDHPRAHTFTVEEWARHAKLGTPCEWPREDDVPSSMRDHGAPYNCQFDAIWSISSLEHDGLGRYGDPISPNADLAAMAKLKDFLAPSGLMYLAVPAGEDAIYWNTGRVYGPKRLSMLIEGWDCLGTFGLPIEAAIAPNMAHREHAMATALQQFRFRAPSGDTFEPILVLSPRG